ncbi:hypothetical protein DRO66_10130 [Candidatus Bathyarchaeota archaeon]|nr:MAG: hypothetical protein DRO66_10130 [Candidatus Bathyarchaeota archaeon]
MAEQGVQDRYIDTFCGRTPKSVLARHYTDYNPERLMRIYDKVNLKSSILMPFLKDSKYKVKSIDALYSLKKEKGC